MHYICPIHTVPSIVKPCKFTGTVMKELFVEVMWQRKNNKANSVGTKPAHIYTHICIVVDPKLFISDPDPALAFEKLRIRI